MKNVVIALIFLLLINRVNAQILIGVNTSLEIPTSNYQEVDNGIGLNLFLGYSFKHRFDVNISYSNSWMSSFIENYKINSYELGTNYYFTDKAFKPFIGLSGGFFIKSFKLAFNNEKYSENGFGIKPRIGCLFDLKKLKGLKINTQIYFNKVFTKQQIHLFGISLGLLFYFS